MTNAYVCKCSCGGVCEVVAESHPQLVSHGKKPELKSVEEIAEMKWCTNNNKCKGD